MSEAALEELSVLSSIYCGEEEFQLVHRSGPFQGTFHFLNMRRSLIEPKPLQKQPAANPNPRAHLGFIFCTVKRSISP